MWLIASLHTDSLVFQWYALDVTLKWPSPVCSLFQIAELVATEFFDQGDKERKELNIEPAVSVAPAAGSFFACARTQLHILKNLGELYMLMTHQKHEQKQDSFQNFPFTYIFWV